MKEGVDINSIHTTTCFKLYQFGVGFVLVIAKVLLFELPLFFGAGV